MDIRKRSRHILMPLSGEASESIPVPPDFQHRLSRCPHLWELWLQQPWHLVLWKEDSLPMLTVPTLANRLHIDSCVSQVVSFHLLLQHHPTVMQKTTRLADHQNEMKFADIVSGKILRQAVQNPAIRGQIKEGHMSSK